MLSFFFLPLHAQLVWCDVTGIRHPTESTKRGRIDTQQQHRPRPAELRGFCGLLYYRVVSLSFLMGALLFPRVLCLCVWGGVPAAPITCTVGCNVFMCVRRLYLDNISESKMGETTGSKRHTRLTLNGKKKMMMIIIIINSSSELVIS